MPGVRRLHIMRELIILILCFGSTACMSYSHTAMYRDKVISPDGTQLRIVPGGRTVFESCAGSGLPLPDASGGYCFYLEVDPATLRQGGRFHVPSDTARSFLWVLHAPSRYTSESVTAEVEVTSVSEKEVSLRITADDKVVPDGWRFSGGLRYSERPIPKDLRTF